MWRSLCTVIWLCLRGSFAMQKWHPIMAGPSSPWRTAYPFSSLRTSFRYCLKPTGTSCLNRGLLNCHSGWVGMRPCGRNILLETPIQCLFTMIPIAEACLGQAEKEICTALGQRSLRKDCWWSAINWRAVWRTFCVTTISWVKVNLTLNPHLEGWLSQWFWRSVL